MAAGLPSFRRTSLRCRGNSLVHFRRWGYGIPRPGPGFVNSGGYGSSLASHVRSIPRGECEASLSSDFAGPFLDRELHRRTSMMNKGTFLSNIAWNLGDGFGPGTPSSDIAWQTCVPPYRRTSMRVPHDPGHNSVGHRMLVPAALSKELYCRTSQPSWLPVALYRRTSMGFLQQPVTQDEPGHNFVGHRVLVPATTGASLIEELLCRTWHAWHSNHQWLSIVGRQSDFCSNQRCKMTEGTTLSNIACLSQVHSRSRSSIVGHRIVGMATMIISLQITL